MNTVVVAAGVVIENGRVLLTQRKAGTHLGGAWEFPGGKVQPGEDPRDALRRELIEELGIETAAGEIVDVTFHRYRVERELANGEVERELANGEMLDKAVLLLFFEATRVDGSPDPRALDVAAFKWASAAELDPARFPPADVAVLRKVKRRLGA